MSLHRQTLLSVQLTYRAAHKQLSDSLLLHRVKLFEQYSFSAIQFRVLLSRNAESSIFVGLRLRLRVKVGRRLLNLCDCDRVLSER